MKVVPMTERLYYTDAYQLTFTGTVVAIAELDGQPAVQLDRTCFYPTSGGQPFDTGTLAGYRVTDVTVRDDGQLYHVVAPVLAADAAIDPTALNALVGTVVAGEITWQRRYDHMQQHSGQHLLSQVFYQQFGFETASVHFSASESTLDLATAEVTPAQLAEAESIANELVYRALPIHAYMVTDAELATVPLRKVPKVQGQIRIVEIDKFDYSACGGTHCRTTAEIGPIKCTKIERRRGQVRVTFLCGKRAYCDYVTKHNLLTEAATLFSNEMGQVPTLIARNLEQLKELQRALTDTQEQLLTYEAAALLDAAERIGAVRLIRACFSDKDKDVATVKRLATQLQAEADVVVLFAVVEGDKSTFCFGCGVESDYHMGNLLRDVLREFGGRGGGKADFAQGGGVAPDQAAAVLDAAQRQLSAKRL